MGMYITTVSNVQRQHFAEMQLYLTAFSFKLNKFDVTKPKMNEKKKKKNNVPFHSVLKEKKYLQKIMTAVRTKLHTKMATRHKIRECDNRL